MFMHALVFPNFGTVVKASKGVCESAAAVNTFLALEVPVWMSVCLILGEELSNLSSGVHQGKFLETYLNVQANTVQVTLVYTCG